MSRLHGLDHCDIFCLQHRDCPFFFGQLGLQQCKLIPIVIDFLLVVVILDFLLPPVLSQQSYLSHVVVRKLPQIGGNLVPLPVNLCAHGLGDLPVECLELLLVVPLQFGLVSLILPELLVVPARDLPLVLQLQVQHQDLLAVVQVELLQLLLSGVQGFVHFLDLLLQG